MTHDEEILQQNCVKWFTAQYRSLERLLHHSPNGGRREIREAAKFKRMGTRAGFPDLILLKPAGAFPYLAVELKTVTGDQEDVQKEYQKLITEAGGCYVVVRTFADFQNVVTAYLRGEAIPEVAQKQTKKKPKMLFEDEKPKRKPKAPAKGKAQIPEELSVREFFSAGGITTAHAPSGRRKKPVYSFREYLGEYADEATFKPWLLSGFEYELIRAQDGTLRLRRM